MSTFSRIISRPTKKEQLKPFASTKPKFATTQVGRGIWQPVYTPNVPPQLYSASIEGDFYTDTLFNPVWSYSSTKRVASGVRVPPNTAQGRTPSSPSLTQDYGSDDLFLTLSSPDIDTPPPTAFSTTAVLGSARIDGTFEDDYDRPEASPNFVRRELRRSKSLRRQARMRDGDFRDSDDEHDHSMTTEMVHRVPTNDTPVEVESDARSDATPSRLSRRVKVPPPINTSGVRVNITAKILRNDYEVEVGQLDGSEFTSSSESGFDADDEHDELRRATKTPEGVPGACEIGSTGHKVSVNTNQKPNSTAPLSTPPKKLYAAIVASSPPRTNTPESKALVPQVVQVAQILEAKQQDRSRAFAWRPFVEPFDV